MEDIFISYIIITQLPYDVDRCKRFCKIFLDNVKRIVTKDHNECIYKFHWKPITNNTVSYDEEAPDKKYRFLEPWFIDKIEEHIQKANIEA